MSFKYNKTLTIALLFGLLLSFLGICAIVSSSKAFEVLISAIGIGFVINGIFDLLSISVSNFIFKSWSIGNTIIDLLLGAMMVVLPWLVGDIIGIFTGIILIIYGLFIFVQLCAFRPDHSLLRFGIVSGVCIVVGILFIILPHSVGEIIMKVIGIICLVVGVIAIVTSILKQFRPETKMSAGEVGKNVPTIDGKVKKEETSGDTPKSEDSSTSSDSPKTEEPNNN